MGEKLNAFFDGLPRARVQEQFEPWPTFLSLGVAGYYAAMIVTIITGLWAGLSMLVLLAVCAACAASFFSYALARKSVTGHETLVLLEHVWFAIACSAVTLWALGEPMLRYLDPAAAGLCFFLAAGRAGCTLVGCCHGPPSSFGITYPQSMVAEGFNRDLWGVRLFPTQTLELFGLVGLGIVCSIVTVIGVPGASLFIFGAGYAVMRFGLESIRFDPRPELLGLSQSRWMALVELGAVAVALEAQHRSPWSVPHVVTAIVLVVTLAISLAAKARLSPSRQLSAIELASVRELVRELSKAASDVPTVRRTARGTSVAVSRGAEGLHISLSARRSPWLACQVLAAALPEAASLEVQLSAAGVIHVVLPSELAEGAAASPGAAALSLYASALRRAQQQPPEAPAAESRVSYFRAAR